MKKMIFSQFRVMCEETFSAFKEYSTIHDLRVWDSYPGDILKERKCWYCCMRLTDDVQMMITFDPEDDDPKPYVCWYDYPCGTINYSHWNFATLEEAMLFCCKEPHKNYRSYKHDNYCLYRPVIAPNGKHMEQVVVGMSVLGVLDYIKNTPEIPEGDYELRKISVYRGVHEGDVIYKIHIDSEYKSEFPFWAFRDLKFPTEIYDFD